MCLFPSLLPLLLLLLFFLPSSFSHPLQQQQQYITNGTTTLSLSSSPHFVVIDRVAYAGDRYLEVEVELTFKPSVSVAVKVNDVQTQYFDTSRVVVRQRTFSVCVVTVTILHDKDSYDLTKLQYNAAVTHVRGTASNYVFIFFVMLSAPIILFVGFFLQGRATRMKNALGFVVTEAEKTKFGFIRWNLMLCISLVVHSVLLVNAVDLHASVLSLVSLLSVDVTSVLNTFHALFLVAMGVRFVQSRKTLYYYIILFTYAFIAISCFLVFLLQIIRARLTNSDDSYYVAGSDYVIPIICVLIPFVHFVVSSGTFGFALKMGRSVEFKDCLTIPSPKTENTTFLLKMQNITLNAILLESMLFIVYNFIIFGFRIGPSHKYIPSFQPFLSGFIEMYSTAIHKAVLLGFGFNGAKHLYSSSLSFYLLSSLVYSGLEFTSLFPLFANVGSNTLYVVSILYLFASFCQKMMSTVGGYYLRREIYRLEAETKKLTPNTAIEKMHFVSSEHLRPRSVVWSCLALSVWWTVECVVMICTELDYQKAQFDVFAMLLNFGLHATFVFALSSYQNSSARFDPKILMQVRMSYMSAFLIFAVVSFFELFCGIAALSSNYTWQLMTWVVIIGVRAVLTSLCSYSFSHITKLTDVEGDEDLFSTLTGDSMHHTSENIENSSSNSSSSNSSNNIVNNEQTVTDNSNNNDNDNNSDNNSNTSSSVYSDSKYSYQIYRFSDSNNVVNRNESGVKDESSEKLLTPEIKANIIGYPPFVLWWSYAFGGTVFLISIFMVATEGPDYSGIVVSPAHLADFGGHMPSYGFSYHFLLLLTGLLLIGIWSNTPGFVHMGFLGCCNIALLSFLQLITITINFTTTNNYVIPHPAYSFFAILLTGLLVITACGCVHYTRKHRNILLANKEILNTTVMW